MGRIIGTAFIVPILVIGAFFGVMHFEPEVVNAGTTWTVGSGPGNDSATINGAIGLANDGDTVFVYSGTYFENVVVDKSINLTGEDRDTTFINGNGVGQAVNVSADRANVSGFTVVNGENGIRFWSTSNTTIENNRVMNNMYGGIVIEEASDNNTVKNNNVSDNGYGIVIAASSGNIVLDNDVSSNAYYGIYIWYSMDTNVTGNRLFGDGVVVLGDLLSHHNTHTIPDSNTVNGKPVIYRKDARDVNIGGIVAGQLILANCTNVRVNGLNISNSDQGMQVAYSSDISITNSTVSGQSSGIRVFYTSNSTLSGNDISFNSFYGIRFFASPNNIMRGNIVSSNAEFGILIDMESSSNEIIGNNVTSNNRGIYLPQVTYNSIYHNNIINNGMQAHDDSPLNYWNDSYPSGGNYWSTYIGVDDFKGPARDIPGSDGLGDTPFSIDVDSRDEYPLIGPFMPGAPPLPPTNLNAELSGPNSESVTITWDLSGDDAIAGTGEDDVFGYAVYRGSVYSPSFENYEFLDYVPNGTSSFVHQNGGEGDPNNHFYCVKAWALDRIGNSSTNQVGKFTRALQSGKNLVSIPLVQSDEDITVVLKTLKFNVAWLYDNTDINDPWKSYNPLKSFNDLATANHTVALWIDVMENSNMTVAGVVPSTTDIWLKAGWNLVGYPSSIGRSVDDALGGIVYERIEGYSPSFPQNLRIYSGTDLMKQGCGYWIKVPSDALWTLNN